MLETHDNDAQEAIHLTSMVLQGKIDAASLELNTHSNNAVSSDKSPDWLLKASTQAFVAAKHAEDLKILQLMRQDIAKDMPQKNGLPSLELDPEFDGGLLIRTHATTPATAFGKLVDSLPLPASFKEGISGTSEQLAKDNVLEEKIGKYIATDLLKNGLHYYNPKSQDYFAKDALRLLDALGDHPNQLNAINVYLPHDQQLTVKHAPPATAWSRCEDEGAQLSMGKQVVNVHYEERDLGSCHPVDLDGEVQNFQHNLGH